MRLHQKSISKVSLVNVLKRRHSSLKNFLKETGIVTYELLKNRCDSMGVIPPDDQEFLTASGMDSVNQLSTVSSPAEGLIVLEPPALDNELDAKIVKEITPSTQASDASQLVEVKDKSSKKNK